MTVDPAVNLVISWCLALLLGAAALHKLRHWHAFQGVLAGYGLAMPLVPASAGLLAVVEVLLAVGLALRLPGTAIGTAGLLGIYAAALATSLLQGLHLADCGCGGRRQPPSWRLVMRNVMLTAAALVLMLPVSARPLGALDVFTVAAAVTALSLLYAGVDALLADRQRWLEESV